ncbi:hypothetical protein ACQHIV_04130 [Kribbella sp. GL6]|uniref:hypothetical protein n=1 Tax=Kribbella sp. GL6 TaxID=3419765 RepID=UPI003D007941
MPEQHEGAGPHQRPRRPRQVVEEAFELSFVTAATPALDRTHPPGRRALVADIPLGLPLLGGIQIEVQYPSAEVVDGHDEQIADTLVIRRIGQLVTRHLDVFD